MDPRGSVSRIYNRNYYTLIHIKYKSSGPCSFKEDLFPSVSLRELGDIFDSMGMNGRIYE